MRSLSEVSSSTTQRSLCDGGRAPRWRKLCGPAGAARPLVDAVDVDPSRAAPFGAHASDADAGGAAAADEGEEDDGVVVDLFVAHDSKLGEERVYIEARDGRS